MYKISKFIIYFSFKLLKSIDVINTYKKTSTCTENFKAAAYDIVI